MYKVCRHIRTSGGRCRSAALANQNFCYYHLTQRQQSITLDLPPLEDRTSIQIAISRVLASLAAGMIDRRDAGMYLYGIQIAATNMRRDLDHIMPDDDVRRVVLTRENDQIAPPRTVFEEKDLNNHKRAASSTAAPSPKPTIPIIPTAAAANATSTRKRKPCPNQPRPLTKSPPKNHPRPILLKQRQPKATTPHCSPSRPQRKCRQVINPAVILTANGKNQRFSGSRTSKGGQRSPFHRAAQEKHLQLHVRKTIICGNI